MGQSNGSRDETLEGRLPGEGGKGLHQGSTGESRMTEGHVVI